MVILFPVTDSKRNFISIAEFEPQAGALSEICGLPGCGKTEAVLQWVGRRLESGEQERVAWVERKFTAYPVAFPQYGVELSRVCFVDAEDADDKKLGWVCQQILSSQAFSIVVIAWGAACSLVELRRLQLAAEKSQVKVVLLADQPSAAALWPIRLQVEASRSPSTGEPRLRVLRNRGGAVALSADSLLARVEELRAHREKLRSLQHQQHFAQHLTEEENVETCSSNVSSA